MCLLTDMFNFIAVAPISAVVPPWNPGLQLGGPGYPGLYEPMNPPAKKSRRSPQSPIQID